MTNDLVVVITTMLGAMVGVKDVDESIVTSVVSSCIVVDRKHLIIDPSFRVSLKFGVVTCLAGFSGVSLGYLMSAKLRVKHNNADAIICAVGLLFATPFLFLALILSKNNAGATWVITVSSFVVIVAFTAVFVTICRRVLDEFFYRSRFR